jgi:DNA-binding transcriptional LysR family regulator
MQTLDWNDLRYFLAVHRAGTLARAATELGINATTVGRRLTSLEEQLRAKLFDRTPEGYRLTPAGQDLVPRAEAMEAQALAVSREVASSDSRLAGLVRVTLTEMLATRFVAPHVPRFHRQTPDVTLELHCTNEVVSLARREADIALRLARPREENVVTKRLSDIPLALYAAHGYVDEHGVPKDAEHDLDGHAVLLFADTRHFRFENEWIVPRAIGARVTMRSDSVSAIYAATTAGLGIALLPCLVADHDRGLVRIRTETGPVPRVIWQTVHRDLRTTARVRAVMTFLEGILAPPPG